MKIGLLLTMILFSNLSLARPDSYECKINGEQELTKGGLDPGIGIYLGKVFHVERTTGTVLGGGLGNTSYQTRNVIDYGGESSAFKLISISKSVPVLPPGRNVEYLQVMEYEASDLKSFVAITGNNVLTGTCK